VQILALVANTKVSVFFGEIALNPLGRSGKRFRQNIDWWRVRRGNELRKNLKRVLNGQ